MSVTDPGPAGIDFEAAHLEFDGWSSDWERASHIFTGGADPGPSFLVLLPDGNVTTAYFYWYAGDSEPGWPSQGYWALQDAVRDEPLDEDGPPSESSMRWRYMPSGLWAEVPTNFEKVGQFFRKFDLKTAAEQVPHFVEKSTFDFRHGHLREELDELSEGYEERDLVKVADAIGDLLYLAYGTAHTFGIPIDWVFAAIHNKNMTKVRARTAADSKRGSQLDVVKPPGFVGPEDDIRGILERAGYVGG